MKLYLDHNVYIECAKNEELKNFIIDICRRKKIQMLYGAAHIEEVYTVEVKPKSPNKEYQPKILQTIDEMTNSTDIMPTLTGLVMKREKTSAVYERVRAYDTTEIVKSDSEERLKNDRYNHARLRREDKESSYISANRSPSDIWEYPAVKKCIDDFNAHSREFIARHNESLRMLESISISGTDLRLPYDFQLIRGSYENRLKNSYSELELAVELLMRVLHYCGYHAENEERKAISSTHDTTHCIYATASDCIISMDKNFYFRCMAVYDFLGVKTQVRYAEDIEGLKRIIEQICTVH